MAVIRCYVSDDDMRELALTHLETGRSIEELAEAAISEACCSSRRARTLPPRGRGGFDCNNTDSPDGDPSPF